jgi:hypothetical protein
MLAEFDLSYSTYHATGHRHRNDNPRSRQREFDELVIQSKDGNSELRIVLAKGDLDRLLAELESSRG